MKIKRILCLILAMACVLALFSCGGPSADAFIKIAGTSSPTKVTTLTTVDDGEETLTGRFETTIYDAAHSETKYQYQAYGDPLVDGLDDYIKDISGTVYSMNGLYSVDGENWTTDIPDAATLQVQFNITKKNLGRISVSDDGKTLTTTVTAAQAKDILGIDIAATEDGVALTIIIDDVYLREVSFSYATENAENISVSTRYNYDAVTSPEDDGGAE